MFVWKKVEKGRVLEDTETFRSMEDRIRKYRVVFIGDCRQRKGEN